MIFILFIYLSLFVSFSKQACNRQETTTTTTIELSTTTTFEDIEPLPEDEPPGAYAFSAAQKRSIVFWTLRKNQYPNQNCYTDINNNCLGTCPNSNKPCQFLKNYNENVCGCLSCGFNSVTGKCEGQCSNIVLQSCISKVVTPTQDSDCKCTTCKSKYINFIDPDYPDDPAIQLPSCSDTGCSPSVSGHVCKPVYIWTPTSIGNGPLECVCFKAGF